MTTSNKLIGPAGKLAELFAKTLPAKDRIKLLLCGEPGIGKTALADMLAANLCAGKWGVESANGRDVSIHVVRRWASEAATSCLFGTGWRVFIVNEVDTMPTDAQDALLSFLDEMPANRAFIGTSNLDLDKLSRRFITRLQRHEVAAPTPDEITAFLVAVHGVPALVAQQIGFICGGCVRAALLDAEAWRNEHRPAAKPARVLQPALVLGNGVTA